MGTPGYETKFCLQHTSYVASGKLFNLLNLSFFTYKMETVIKVFSLLMGLLMRLKRDCSFKVFGSVLCAVGTQCIVAAVVEVLGNGLLLKPFPLSFLHCVSVACYSSFPLWNQLSGESLR